MRRAVRGWCFVGDLEADVVLVRLMYCMFCFLLMLPNADYVR